MATGQNVAIRDLVDGNTLASIASDLLLEELSRRQENPKPKCGSKKEAHYNTPLHVFALILILAVSTIACSFPIIARRFPKLPIPHKFLFYSKHFGTGVLIATAFVHLLPTAFVSMTDPCLPSFWNSGYPAMAGLIAMTSVFFVMTVEMFFAIKGAGHVHGAAEWDLVDGGTEEDFPQTSIRGGEYGKQRGNSFSMRMQHLNASAEQLVPPKKQHGTDSEQANGSAHYYDDDSESDLDLETLDPIPSPDPAPAISTRPSHHHHHPSVNLDPPNPQKLLLQCLLLEAGILFHSIFIGMSLSVSTGSQFLVLLVAISFHQTFEGFALGSRISALIPSLFPASSPKPWLMALAYGTTTPIGQAIGLGLHELYDPASATGLLMVGITNAVSSGLLLFAGLVELLAEDFLSDRSYATLKGQRRIEACLAVAGGGALMALVGAWA